MSHRPVTLGGAHALATPGLAPTRPALRLSALALAIGLTLPLGAQASQEALLLQMRQELEALRQQYDARIKALEAQLQAVQRSAPAASPQPTDAAQAVESASMPPPPPLDPGRAMSATGANRFNPAISLVLSGGYNGLSRTPDSWTLPGFLPSGGEVGPGERGFTLGESELTFSGSIDPLFQGSLTLAITPENEAEVEEAYVQTQAHPDGLPAGLRLRAGRFLAGLGYQNEQHSHTWDFVDLPLAHQAFLGGQFRQEGVQARWQLPLSQPVELGLELGNGHAFPGNNRQRNGAGSLLLSAHTGGDVGLGHSWRAGASWLRTRAEGREWTADDTTGSGNELTHAYRGRDRLWVLDGVWKWAPNRNAMRTSVQLQGEYFRHQARGSVTHDTTSLSSSPDQTDAYRASQSGWYLQGIYQFAGPWRVGLRHDQLDTGSVDFGQNQGLLATEARKPQRHSVMLDWSPSEFSRWRLQFSEDRVRAGTTDHQVFLRYTVNLGAHGAHSF